jgi:hypothetical protein
VVLQLFQLIDKRNPLKAEYHDFASTTLGGDACYFFGKSCPMTAFAHNPVSVRYEFQTRKDPTVRRLLLSLLK